MARSPFTDEQRSEAIELCRLHGSREASRRMGISEATVRRWATQVDVSSPNLVAWAERRIRLADKAGETAEEFIASMKIAAAAEDPDMLKALTSAFSVLVDKAQLLTGGATGRDERRSLPSAYVRDTVEARVLELRNRALSA